MLSESSANRSRRLRAAGTTASDPAPPTRSSALKHTIATRGAWGRPRRAGSHFFGWSLSTRRAHRVGSTASAPPASTRTCCVVVPDVHHLRGRDHVAREEVPGQVLRVQSGLLYERGLGRAPGAEHEEDGELAQHAAPPHARRVEAFACLIEELEKRIGPGPRRRSWRRRGAEQLEEEIDDEAAEDPQHRTHDPQEDPGQVQPPAGEPSEYHDDQERRDTDREAFWLWHPQSRHRDRDLLEKVGAGP